MSSAEDGTIVHTWLFERTTVNNGQGSFTTDGVENIARHKYKGGDYTFFDNFFNPFWDWCAQLLPLWLAPNMVTTFGGMFSTISYVIIWYYSPQFDEPIPNWVVCITGVCALVYYTFDCMDGKQARRTQTSSPLGQLFDHGLDCLTNLTYLSMTNAILMCGRSKYFFVIQTSLQLSFFLAQWEEYYTHRLPHAAGNFGVTEMNYGIGLSAIASSFLNREYIFSSTVESMLPPDIAKYLPGIIAELQSRHAAILLWILVVIVLVSLSVNRVITHENVRKNRTHLSAISKLITPALITATPFMLQTSVINNETRNISAATGFLFCLITIKMICFSMAKMSYAAVQLEAMPYFFTTLWITFDKNITPAGVGLLLRLLSFWYFFRLLLWSRGAILQICKRLDIYCFSIKKKVNDDKKES